MRCIDSPVYTVLITGVSRGLGRAMVDEFISLGHKIIGCARTKSRIVELARLYPESDFQTVDVASDEQVMAWAKRVLKHHDPPDFLLNNAAIINHKAPLWQFKEREFSEVIDTNIKGAVNVVRHFVPAMITRKRGVIVNFSSRWGKSHERNMAPYCATKWAVEAITRVLADELKNTGVAAIGLNPGIIKTRMLDRYLAGRISSDSLGYLTPTEWARIAAPAILRLNLKDSGRTRAILGLTKSQTIKQC